MELALISDIHGNLEALEAVLDEVDALHPDLVYCLGDLVGYGADPGPCVHKARGAVAACLLGNHDAAVVGLTDPTYFNPVAREAVEWTQRQLDAESLAYLRGLPLALSLDGALLVHSTPFRPEEWHYLTDTFIASRSFASFSDPMAFVGHSHQPVVFVFRDGAVTALAPPGRLRVQQGERYLVNVGSVGQPRDGDPRACFVLYETAGPTVRFRRVEYDVERAQAKILEAGLPEVLAARLAFGR